MTACRRSHSSDGLLTRETGAGERPKVFEKPVGGESRDFHLGNLLSDLVTHLAHAHGLDDAATSASEPVESEFVASEPVDNAAENNGEEAGVTTPPKSSKGKK